MAPKPTEKRGTKDGKPGVWVTYPNGDKFFRADPAPKTPASSGTPSAVATQKAVIQKAAAAKATAARAPSLATELNNAWAAANPGKASPDGTVFNPIESLGDLPAGSVDPALVYQSGAANRGLGYQSDDYNLNFGGADVGLTERPADWNATVPLLDHEGKPVLDPATGEPRVVPKYGRAVRDYWRDYDRTEQQFGWEKADATTTRGRTLGDLIRDYQTLGNNQLQAINQAGVLGGGALAQSAQKRAAAQSRTEGRVNEDYNTVWGAGGRAETVKGQTLADLLTGTQRSATDAYTGLQRAIGENAPYQATLYTQGVQQAQGSLAGNPGYEVHNGVIYQRTPGGGLTPTGKTGGGATGGGTGSAPQNNGTGGFKAPANLGKSGRPKYTWAGRRATPFGAVGGFTY